LLYEYKIKHPQSVAMLSSSASGDGLHNGFANTTAVHAGAMADVAKSVAVGLDVWYLQSTEKVRIDNEQNPDADETSKDLGYEIDAKVNWKLSDSLSWNWNLGYFKPGKAYSYIDADGAKHGEDAATGIQGVLSLKF